MSQYARLRLLAPALLSSLCSALLPATGRADWPSTPNANLAICASPNTQSAEVLASDGAGGAFVVWQDLRSGTANDIYAMRVLNSGLLDSAWPANGAAICAATGQQVNPRVVPDATGGAFVIWQDVRSGSTSDVYAQHIEASGAAVAGWPANGLAVCSAVGNQNSAAVVPDGAGGAVVVWQDSRSGTTSDIYAQHLLGTGVDSAWPANGLAVCVVGGNQQFPLAASDGHGGMIVAWLDFRSGSTSDVYCQHLLATGAIDSGWPADGAALCTATGNQQSQGIVSDGAGGAIVVWQDSRTGISTDIYAQRVAANGTVDSAWPVDGVPVCTAPNDQTFPRIVSDGQGGAIVAWADARVAALTDVYAQRITGAGIVSPGWPVDGTVLCSAVGTQTGVAICADGSNGAIVGWSDSRSGNFDIYARRVLSTGSADLNWPADGRGVSTASGTQDSPSILPDGSGGSILTWTDSRGGPGQDIYAQRVQQDGVLGGAVVGVPQDSRSRIVLAGVAPNPLVGRRISLRFGLDRTAAVQLQVLDLAGRELETWNLEEVPEGSHSVDWVLGRTLAPGLYFIRLVVGRESLRAKVVVLR